eukprot:252400_1
MEDDKALRLSLQNGYIDITEWILFCILAQDTKHKVRMLNQTIQSSKSGRQFEEWLKQLIARIVDKEIKQIDEIDDITNVFAWLLTHDPIDIPCIKLILSKLPNDDHSGFMLMKKTRWWDKQHGKMDCLSYVAKHNQWDVLRLLLGNIQNCGDTLIMHNNEFRKAFMDAILSRSDKCVRILLEFIKSSKVKDSFITAFCSELDQNKPLTCALTKASHLKSKTMIKLILSHHSRADSILCDSFIEVLKQRNVEAASMLLNHAKTKSVVLHYADDSNDTALMHVLRGESDECLKFIVDELNKESDEKEAVHPIYTARNDRGA